jgi:signal transduction histidine kinase
MDSVAVLSATISKSTSARYAIGLVATLVALLACLALAPLLDNYAPYATFFPAVAFCAWFCGLGPCILAVVLALFSVRYWFVSPVHSFQVLHFGQLSGMVAFAIGSSIIAAIAEAGRRENDRLRQAHGELDERVRLQTAELDAVNHSLGEVTGRLLQLQDEERRRIARELHDSVGQTLAVLAMNLSEVGADIERFKKTASSISDSAALVADMSRDIRTISYLLHPPLLDEAGLAPALDWYVKGFVERSKTRVDLQLPEDLGRLPRDLETAIFRVVQECLTNIHRHSESPTAKISVSRSSAGIRVEVEDKGKGLSLEKLSEIVSSGTVGVGIRGMRERLRQLGGSLEISSKGIGEGTLVVAQLPLPVESFAAESLSSDEMTRSHPEAPMPQKSVPSPSYVIEDIRDGSRHLSS